MFDDMCVIFIAILASCFYVNAQDAPRVTTFSGKIRGHYLSSVSGNKFKAFEGIPFAEKPVGPLRFQPPVPVKPWPDELAADKFKGACMGITRAATTAKFTLKGAEDCLYLNVYVPEGEFDQLLPVIFYIYGGGYQMAILTGQEQKHLIDQNVIVVTFGYRLGPLGFLSTDDAVVPGNMGLKDQALALTWIYDNIKNFGGDSKRITLIGLSAGAASVHLHYLSPMTAGMFRSGISFSGTALSYWALKRNPRVNAVKLGEILKCPTKDMGQMVDCFRTQPAEKLMMASGELYPWILYMSIPFGPVIEKTSSKPFLNRDPVDIINSGNFPGVNTPWITGVVSDEGLLSIVGFMSNNSALQEFNTKWTTVAPDILSYDFNQARNQQISEEILKKYLGGKPISNANLKDVVRMLSNGMFNIHAGRAAKAMARANNNSTWFYFNSYRPSNNIAQILISLTNAKNFTLDYGPTHTDDVLLTFKSFPSGPNLTAQDLEMRSELLRLWTSVAKTGSPQGFESEWRNVDADKIELDYLHIAGPRDLKPKTFQNFGDIDFWKSINFIK